MALCKTCGAPLSNDELGLNRKLLGRTVTQAYCLDCLADQFHCSRALLENKIEQFRRLGCALFTTKGSK